MTPTNFNLDDFAQKIGKVEYLRLGYGDHGVLTFYVVLDFKGSSQRFGGWSLDDWDEKTEKRCGSVLGTECILRLLRCFNVDDISEIKDKRIVALYSKPHVWGSKIIGLAPLPCDEGEPFLMDEVISFCKTREFFKVD